MNIADDTGQVMASGKLEQLDGINVNPVEPSLSQGCDNVDGEELAGGISSSSGEARSKDNGVEDGVLTFINDSELSYMYHEAGSVPDWLMQTYADCKLRRLDLSHNKISDLSGIEAYSSTLEELILDDNHINDQTTFPTLNMLHTLFMNKNKIADIEHLCGKLATACPNLSYLSLIGNPACWSEIGNTGRDIDPHDYNRYRLLVVSQLPGLHFLDWERVTGAERRRAEACGSMFKVARPAQAQVLQPQAESSNATSGQAHPYDSAAPANTSGRRDVDDQMGGVGSVEVGEDAAVQFNPLPADTTHIGSHTGTFKRNEYQYIGKHSEGNRFITNDSL